MSVLLFPPVPAVMPDDALAFRTVAFLEERYLISDAELDELCDIQVSLRTRLQIEIIPNTILQTKSYVVPCLF